MGECSGKWNLCDGTSNNGHIYRESINGAGKGFKGEEWAIAIDKHIVFMATNQKFIEAGDPNVVVRVVPMHREARAQQFGHFTVPTFTNAAFCFTGVPLNTTLEFKRVHQDLERTHNRCAKEKGKGKGCGKVGVNAHWMRMYWSRTHMACQFRNAFKS